MRMGSLFIRAVERFSRFEYQIYSSEKYFMVGERTYSLPQIILENEKSIFGHIIQS